MPRALAINVGANTNEPGFRGPIDGDGRFTFVPIPETEPTRERVPTYADLGLDRGPVPDLAVDVSTVADVPVHLDPEFATYPHGEAYTYGDPHPTKAGPIADLDPGDWLLFYATLTVEEGDGAGGDGRAAWLAPTWGAYLIGEFRVARVVGPDPGSSTAGAGPASDGGDPREGLAPRDRERFRSNAHLKRERFDARVLVAGESAASGLFDRAIPLSSRDAGADANRLVTALSADSGRGPWWRRPLRFDAEATAELRGVIDDHAVERCFG